MASKRDAKKDILFFVEEVLTDCLVFLECHPDNEYPEVEEIINDMETLYADLIYNVNHIEVEEGKTAKQYFDALYMNLLDAVHVSFEKLSEIAKK